MTIAAAARTAENRVDRNAADRWRMVPKGSMRQTGAAVKSFVQISCILFIEVDVG